MSSNEVDQLELYSVPEWLTNKFLDEHLRNYFNNNQLEVFNFEATPATKKGENFASTIIRVHVIYSVPSKDAASIKKDLSSISLILKEAITDEYAVSVLSQFDVYNKEIEFYSDVAPKINQKLKELHESELFAASIGVCKKRNVLILEDLSAKGYQMLAKKSGFNFIEAKAILEKIATFHAICAVLQEENPGVFANFKYGHISRETNAFNDYYPLTLDALIEVISEWDDFTIYANKLRRIRDDVLERARKTYDLNGDHFNTLNHDDLWYTNFLIKPANEHFENIMLIDFQFAYWSSPTTDLHYFLGSSLANEDSPHRIDELVHIYYNYLVDFLQRLNNGKSIPAWPQFRAQYYERRFLGFIMSCLVRPFQVNNTELAGPSEMMESSDLGLKARRGLFKGEQFQASLRKLIPYYDQLGTFD